MQRTPGFHEKYDQEVFDEAKEEGLFTSDEFLKYCSSHGFSQHNSHQAMAAFLQNFWGRDISCVMLTANVQNAKAAYTLVVTFAKTNDLILDDPQLGTEIDLRNAGQLPPQY